MCRGSRDGQGLAGCEAPASAAQQAVEKKGQWHAAQQSCEEHRSRPALRVQEESPSRPQVVQQGEGRAVHTAEWRVAQQVSLPWAAWQPGSPPCRSAGPATAQTHELIGNQHLRQVH